MYGEKGAFRAVAANFKAELFKMDGILQEFQEMQESRQNSPTDCPSFVITSEHCVDQLFAPPPMRRGSNCSEWSWGDDINHDVGLLAPGSNRPDRVVVVPSPFIRSINSPLGSPYSPWVSPQTMQPMMQGQTSPDSLFQCTRIDECPLVSFDDFIKATMQHLPNCDPTAIMPPVSPLPENWADMSTFSAPLDVQPVLTPSASEETLSPNDLGANGMYDKVPDGKFWNTIKADGKTAYQCPWPECKKRTLHLPSLYKAL